MSTNKHKSPRTRKRSVGGRAPLVPAALGVVVGVVISESAAPVGAWVAITIFVVTCTVIAVWARNATDPPIQRFVALVILAAGSLGYWRHQMTVQLPPEHVAHVVGDQPVLTRIAGQIVTSPTATAPQRRNPFIPFDPPPQVRFVLASTAVLTSKGEQPLSGYIRVTLDSPGQELRLGDRVLLTGKLFRPRPARNPGETDWAAQMRLQGIYAGMSVESDAHVKRRERPTDALALVDRVRAFARSLLFEPSVAAEHGPAVRVLDSMVLGQRSAVGQQINDAFLRTGVIHFLSVSGAHVGALAVTVTWLLRRVLGVGRRPTAVASMLAMIAYLVLAEPNAPILRATLMGVCVCFAMLINRPLSPLNWLALSALLVLARPLDLFQAGFQLSFIQVAIMILVLPRLIRFSHFVTSSDRPAEAANWFTFVWATVRDWVRAGAMTSLVCWLSAVPLALHHFQMLTPWAALHSLMLTPLILAITLLSFAAMLVRAVTFGFVTTLNGFVIQLTDFLVRAVDGLAAWPGTLIELPAPPLVVIFGLYVGGYWVARLFTTRKPAMLDQSAPRSSRVHQVTFALAVPMLAWIPGAICAQPSAGAAKIVVLSVGSGSASVVYDERERVAVIDVGTVHNFDAGTTIVDALRETGTRRVEWASISHDNFDHYSGLPTLLKRTAIGGMFAPVAFADSLNGDRSREPLARVLGDARPKFGGWKLGDHVQLGDCAFEVMWPPVDLHAATSENDRSLVLRMRAADRSVLFPGDIEEIAIRGLLDLHHARQIDLRCDVLIAPHHGSIVKGHTAALLEAVAPEVIIVSTAKDRDELGELVARTLGATCRVLSTDDVGAVTVHVRRDGRIAVEGFVKP